MPPTRKSIRRDILRFLKNHGNKSYRPKELANKLAYKDNQTYRLFRDVLSEMDEHRMIGRLKGGRYTYKPRPTKVEGILTVNPGRFGFVAVPDEKEDLFVAAANMGTALDGDRVQVGLAAPSRGGRQREAEILDILERRRKKAVGTFSKKGHFGFVLPDDQKLVHDIYVPREAFNGANDGDKVVVSIDRFDDPRAAPEGRVLEVLGRASDPKVRVTSLAMGLNVRVGFPDDVEKAAAAIPTEIPKSEISRRLDLRDRAVFTIDPDDAKDFDDALHVTELPNGNLEVGVHIADVSHYVTRGSSIDDEGYRRATSVYLVDRVVPMLPEKLSNEVCSLRPGEDKLTYSCIMEVSTRGAVKSYEIRETVIHSKQRFTYEDAEQLLQGGHPDHALASEVVTLGRLTRTLTRKRLRMGSVDFDLPEVKVILDEEGNPVDIVRKVRLDAHRLVEELMLLANKAVAYHIGQKHKGKAFPYRIHGEPDGERIRQLAEYVRAFGYRLPLNDGNVESRDLNNLLQHVKGSAEEFVIEDAALRAMSKAVYSIDNIGHYGLGFKSYAHFTSPIRRYPDLIAHRLLKRYETGKGGVDGDQVESALRHCSDRERSAVEAERESVKLKQVEYIRGHLGERFDGVVVGVTKFGIIVLLTDVQVEGMVHVRDLDDDHYVYDEGTYTLVGDYTGKSFRPGDQISVVVAGANLASRKIDLTLSD